MDLTFIEYPKCTTCIKAKKFLEDKGIAFTDRHLKIDNPTYKELSGWAKKFGIPAKKFFNTSGLIYRGQNMKEKSATMTEDEILKEIANPAHEGMLVKRPLLVCDDFILIGFKESEWKEKLNIEVSL